MCSKEIELLRHVLQTGEVKNPSKVTKDTLMAVIKYMVPRICDPTLNAKLVHDLTAPCTDDDSAAKEDDDIFYNSQESTQNQSGPEAEGKQQILTQPDRPKLCKSRWSGSTCQDADCTRAHPSYCKEESCKEKRNPSCLLWHVRNKRPGNWERRAAAPSGPKSGSFNRGSNNTGKKSLKLKLLSSQLEVYKAKEKMARLARARPIRKTYAEAVAATPQPHPTPTQTQLTAQVPSATSVHPNNLGHVVELLTAVLSTLQSQARL